MEIRIRKTDFERIREYMEIVERQEETTGLILRSNRDFERVKAKRAARITDDKTE